MNSNENLPSYKKLVSFVHPYKVWLIINISITILNAGLNVIVGYFIKTTIDTTIANGKQISSTIILLSILLILCGILIKYFLIYSSGRFSTYAVTDLKKAIYSKVQAMTVSSIESRHSGDIISRMSNDVEAVGNFLSNTVTSLVYNPIVLICTSIYLLILDWRLYLITMSLIPLTIFIANRIGVPTRSYKQGISESEAKEVSAARDVISGIAVSKAFNLEGEVFKKYENAVDYFIHYVLKYEKLAAILTPFEMIIRLVPFLFCCTFGGYLAVKGVLTSGSLFAFIFLLDYLIEPTATIPRIINDSRAALVSFTRINELLTDVNQEIKNEKVLIENNSNAIEFKDVSFSYGDLSVHNNLSFQIPKGKVVALVGPSGCGKSTIFKLLCGFINPSHGEIYVNGVNSKKENIEYIRNQLSMVFQDTYLFPTTLAENISYGNIEASMDEIVEASKKADAHNFIMELPQGYQTLVGERGIKLSGGQKQRISIAMALLKNAPILLLDEPTSALDTQTETNIHKSIENHIKNHTVFIIAHRFSTIKNADYILVMDNGKIVETGTHNDLIKFDGLYKKLYLKQSSKDVQEMEALLNV